MRPAFKKIIRPVGINLMLIALLVALTPRVPVTLTAQAKRPSESVITASSAATKMRVSEAYGNLPLSFEPNRGQTDRRVEFLSRGSGYTLFLMPTEAVLRLSKPDKSDPSDPLSNKTAHAKKSEQALLRMKLVGANSAARATGENELQGRSNYLVGNDRKRWRTDIPTFSRVRYSEVYPGIDAIFYGTNQRQLEYDFVVEPGADTHAIRLSFDGADEMSLDWDGHLRLKMKGGEVTQPAPVVYQQTESGEKQQVAGHYVLKGDNEVAFEIAEYDRSRELVIDPQLLYGTFYGGSNTDTGEDIAVDASGNAYITGETQSSNLILKSPYDGSLAGQTDVFVVKLNPGGSDIVYATYLGSSENEGGTAIAITSDGRACVTGETVGVDSNHDFPTTPSRFQGAPGLFSGRDIDSFLTVLAPGGNTLSYSTYFGGGSRDIAHGIAVDAANRIYITGETASDGRGVGTGISLPMKNAFQNTLSDGLDAFIAKFDPAQSGNSSLVYSSFLGGSGGEIGNDIAVTPVGVAFFVGVTGSFNYPTKSSSSLPPFQTIQGGVNDSFIAKVSPSGALIYSTFFGGNDRDEAQSVAVDSDERAYVTGLTLSSAATFPLKNAFQPNRIGTTRDAFVAKFNADGTTLFYSSFLGSGTIINEGDGIAIDGGGNAYITGFTAGLFTSVNGFPSSVSGGPGLVAKIAASDATGATTPKLLYMDNFNYQGNAIAVDPRGNVYIVGDAFGNFTTTAGAFQETNAGGSDAAVIKIGSTFPDTIGVFRPSNGQFFLRNSNTAGPPNLTVDFGQSGDQPVAGDWNGDGIDDVGVFRPSTNQFLLRQHTRLQFGGIINATITLNFGTSGDRAVVGDWNGDGIDTPGVFRPSTNQWFLTNGPNTNNTSPISSVSFIFGQSGDLPVAGDFNGDGIDTIGTFTAATGTWRLRNTNSAGSPDITLNGVGVAGDLPVVGDFDGDGIDTPGGLRGSTWFLLNNFQFVALNFDFGQPGDIPIVGDWDGSLANTPPDSGVNNPSSGSSLVGQPQTFTTTCSDPDGWHDISTIDFRLAKSDGTGNGVPLALWVQFDENHNLIRFYNPDLQTWQEGVPGSNVVLSSRFADLYLAGTHVQGSGPTGPSVQVTWSVVFKADAVMNNYKQYLQITDDAGLSTGFDKVGTWSIRR